MGLPWFRVDVAMVDHPRTYALCDRLNDPRAGWYVIRLWSWVMRYAARGRLADGARTALERACEWGGEAGELVRALVDVGWLESDPSGGLVVHDWDEHQGAAVEKAEKDSERKREDRKRRGNGARTARAESADGARTARVQDVTGRDVTILPTLSDKSDRPKPRGEKANLTDDENDVFEHWRKTMKHPNAIATKARQKLIARWLPDYGVERLQAAIDGCAMTPHNMGQNETHTRYDSLELILRDAGHIERFEATARRGAA